MHMPVPSITPLPLRIKPQPWEDLHSFLVRTAIRMQYDKAALVIQPELIPYHIASSHISLLTELPDYTFLSDLLLLSQDTLYHMTLHRFSAPFQHINFFPVLKDWNHDQYLQSGVTSYCDPIQKPRLEKGLRRSFFLPNQTTQICALCLQEDVAYDRLYWQSRYLLTCHKHAILLQRQCSTCHKRIPSQRMKLTSCPFCHHAYYDPSSTPVPIPSEATYLLHADRLTLRNLGVICDQPHPLCDPIAHDPRVALPPAQYFALMQAFCICIHPLHTPDFQTFLPPTLLRFLLNSTITDRSLPNFIPPQQVAVAQWIFTRWPHHFFIFLDALELWSRQAKKRHAFSSFPQRFLLGSTAHEAYALLSQPYREYRPTYNINVLQHHLASFNLPKIGVEP